MIVFISKVNNYMFRPKAAIFQVITITILLKEFHIYVYIDKYMKLFRPKHVVIYFANK